MDRDKLKLMDAALERLDYDEFGICDDCGETIPRKRLEAIPWAAYCLPVRSE
jgi:DnaK suppressor protein